MDIGNLKTGNCAELPLSSLPQSCLCVMDKGHAVILVVCLFSGNI
jgi:hypothetical protein